MTINKNVISYTKEEKKEFENWKELFLDAWKKENNRNSLLMIWFATMLKYPDAGNFFAELLGESIKFARDMKN